MPPGTASPLTPVPKVAYRHSLKGGKEENGCFCWIICRFRRHPAVIPSLPSFLPRQLGRHYTRTGGFFWDPVEN